MNHLPDFWDLCKGYVSEYTSEIWPLSLLNYSRCLLWWEKRVVFEGVCFRLHVLTRILRCYVFFQKKIDSTFLGACQFFCKKMRAPIPFNNQTSPNRVWNIIRKVKYACMILMCWAYPVHEESNMIKSITPVIKWI